MILVVDLLEELYEVSKNGEAEPRSIMYLFWLAHAACQTFGACVFGQCP